MACKNDGAGAFFGFTITEDAACNTGSNIDAKAQPQVPPHDATQADAAAHMMATQKTAEEWRVRVERFESPRTVDKPGSLANMRFGSYVQHDPMPINFDWPWEQDFDMLRLIATRGSLTKAGPDGSYYSGNAIVLEGVMQPLLSEEESIGQIVFSWLGSEANPLTFSPPPYDPANLPTLP